MFWSPSPIDPDLQAALAMMPDLGRDVAHFVLHARRDAQACVVARDTVSLPGGHDVLFVGRGIDHLELLHHQRRIALDAPKRSVLWAEFQRLHAVAFAKPLSILQRLAAPHSAGCSDLTLGECWVQLMLHAPQEFSVDRCWLQHRASGTALDLVSSPPLGIALRADRSAPLCAVEPRIHSVLVPHLDRWTVRI